MNVTGGFIHIRRMKPIKVLDELRLLTKNEQPLNAEQRHNPETMRKHYLNLDEVAIADQVFTRMGAYCWGIDGISTPKKRLNPLHGKGLSMLPDKGSNLGPSG